MRRGIAGFVVLVVLVVMAGGLGWWWLSRPGGLGEAAEDPDVASCFEDAGLSLDGAADLSGWEQRELLTRPGSLACLTTHVPAGELPSALGQAFPEVDEDGSFEEARDARRERANALTTYVMASTETVATSDLVDVMAVTLRAFDEIDADWYRSDDEEFDDAWAAEAYHLPIALSLYERDHGELPGYADWLARTENTDSVDMRLTYLQEQQNDGTRFGDDVRALRDEVDEAHDER